MPNYSTLPSLFLPSFSSRCYSLTIICVCVKRDRLSGFEYQTTGATPAADYHASAISYTAPINFTRGPCIGHLVQSWNLVTCCRLLRAELQSLRRRGAYRVDAASLDRPTIESHRTCARCLCELGRIINRGAPCRSCRLRVCKACREFTNRTTDWVCLVCHKQMWVSNYQSTPICAAHICLPAPTLTRTLTF